LILRSKINENGAVLMRHQRKTGGFLLNPGSATWQLFRPKNFFSKLFFEISIILVL
jgi:hypothetical protein